MTARDPMLAAIKAERAADCATHEVHGDDAINAVVRHWNRAYRNVASIVPTSLKGAVAALDLLASVRSGGVWMEELELRIIRNVAEGITRHIRASDRDLEEISPRSLTVAASEPGLSNVVPLFRARPAPSEAAPPDLSA
jgi:hypothetical protein